MDKKTVIKTALAGIGIGCLVGIKVCLDIYDFGYQTGVKSANGDKAAKAMNETLQICRGAVADMKKSK